MEMKEFASKLNGREYGEEISRDEARLAKENGWLVVFGASDDLTEFRGAINDEVDNYGGGPVKIGAKGPIRQGECDDEYLEAGWTPPKTMVRINAEWNPEGFDASWLITADKPFEAFDIMEDGELFCRGAIIDFGGI